MLTFIKSNSKLKNIPVIMMDNISKRDNVSKCIINGAADYWYKPIRINLIK